MQTRLLANVEPLADDHLILRDLQLGQREGASPESACTVGIRNAHGHVYRLIRVQGLGETLRVVRVMQRLGFTEEDHPSPADGCGSTFYRRQKTSNQPVAGRPIGTGAVR